jgi:DNA-binding transcriptional LysR family regulator
MISSRTGVRFRSATSTDVRIEPRAHHQLVVNDTNTYRRRRLAGLGIIQAPTYAVHEALKAGRLVAVLEDWRHPSSR